MISVITCGYDAQAVLNSVYTETIWKAFSSLIDKQIFLVIFSPLLEKYQEILPNVWLGEIIDDDAVAVRLWFHYQCHVAILINSAVYEK